MFLSAGIRGQQMRAVWITNVDSYVLYTDKAIAEAMNYLASAGINTVFPVVWNKGYTLYPSSIMQKYFGVPIMPVFAGRDPLGRLIIEAHRNGIEVIPWFEFGFSSSYSADGGHIIKKFPQWALRDASGKLVVKNGFDWMSAANPETQNFIISLITETIDNYNVDGVQGDDRLPAMPVEGGYDSVTVALYKSENSGKMPPAYYDAKWMRWRADKLNQFLKRLRDSVKTRGTDLIVSSAPSNYPWGYENYLQDSKTWVDSGYIDNFIPQLYRDNIASYKYELNNAINYVPSSRRDIFFPGILIKSGSYTASAEYLNQALKANREAGANGEAFFFYEGLRLNNNALGETLRNGYYSSPSLPPFRHGNVRRPKAVVVNENDPGAVITGPWREHPRPGFSSGILLGSDTAYTSISYSFSVPVSAWYEVYAYNIPSLSNTSRAQYTVYDSRGDSANVSVDQSDIKNEGWQKVSDVFLNAGTSEVLKLDNSGIESGKYITADAAMIMINRKLSPSAVITAVGSYGDKHAGVPRGMRLYQNYPNPFNPSTVISYELPQAVHITLKVFDILGREVSLLEDGMKPAGLHSVQFNASSLPSGVYFCRLSSSSFTSVRKMLLVR